MNIVQRLGRPWGIGLLCLLAAGLALAEAASRAEEPAGPEKRPAGFFSSLLRENVPQMIDIGRTACQRATEAAGIHPVRTGELADMLAPDSLAAFPPAVLAAARIYFDMPLGDPSTGIGLLTSLSGGHVLGLAFEDEVYLGFPRADLKSRKFERVLIHELGHVAQYHAFGYEGYKAAYASDIARGAPYEAIESEAECIYLAALYPERLSRAFFAFYRYPDVEERVEVVKPDGGRELQPLSALGELRRAEVEITDAREVYPRAATLVLGAELPEAIPCQVLDPHGGPPLLVLHAANTDGLRLAANGRPSGDGPCVLLLTGGGPESIAVWRRSGRWRQQRLAGVVEASGGGMSTLVRTDDAGMGRRWQWDGERYVARGVSEPDRRP